MKTPLPKKICQECGAAYASYDKTSQYCSKTCAYKNTGAKIAKHGMYKSRAYSRWNGMKDRCRNPNNKRYADYGGRGITVDQRWLVFENFYAHMGDPPTPSHTLDRIDNSKGYSKENCRWANAVEQQNNTRRNVVIEFRGTKANLKQWAGILGISYCVLQTRIKRGWSVERAFTEQINEKLPDGGMKVDGMFTVSHVAKILGYTVDQVRALTNKGELIASRDSRGFRVFNLKDVEAFINAEVKDASKFQQDGNAPTSQQRRTVGRE